MAFKNKKPKFYSMRFIGNDSLGYVHGTVYKMRFDTGMPNTICRLDGSGTCMYASLKGFMNNWDEITLIPEKDGCEI